VHKLRSVLDVSSPIAITAILSIVVLIGVSVVKITGLFAPNGSISPNIQTASAGDLGEDWRSELEALGYTVDDGTSATSSDQLSILGPIIAGELLNAYEQIKAQGAYTEEDLQRAGEEMAAYVKAAVTFDVVEETELVIDADTSKNRVQKYRDEMTVALTPLNDIGAAEYEIYARYDETRDAKYLAQLLGAADVYRIAAQSAADVSVPKDAARAHRDIINALLAFAEVLEGLATHADDPFASVALLRSYMETEASIEQSYARMRTYYTSKML
jgi:hypothetical protein